MCTGVARKVILLSFGDKNRGFRIRIRPPKNGLPLMFGGYKRCAGHWKWRRHPVECLCGSGQIFSLLFYRKWRTSRVLLSQQLLHVIINKSNLWHSTSKGEQDQAVVCRKCWWEVKIFHEFYIRIESLHCVSSANENIYVEDVTEHLKISLLAKEESNEFKRYPDEDYHTAEYLRDRFGRLMAVECRRHFRSGLIQIHCFFQSKTQICCLHKVKKTNFRIGFSFHFAAIPLSLASELINRSKVWHFLFFSPKVRHRPNHIKHLCHWYSQKKNPSKRDHRGKRKTFLMRLSRSEICDPRKRHTKRITKVAAKMHRKYSSEFRYVFWWREFDSNWWILSLQLWYVRTHILVRIQALLPHQRNSSAYAIQMHRSQMRWKLCNTRTTRSAHTAKPLSRQLSALQQND